MRGRRSFAVGFAALCVTCACPAVASGDPTDPIKLEGLLGPHVESGIMPSLGSSTPERGLVASDVTLKVGYRFFGFTPLIGIATRTSSFEPRFQGEFRMHGEEVLERGLVSFFSLGFEVGHIGFDRKGPDGKTISDSIRANSLDVGIGLEYRFKNGFAVGGALKPYLGFWDLTVERMGVRDSRTGTTFGVSTPLYFAWAP